jgi:hypothetical protein
VDNRGVSARVETMTTLPPTPILMALATLVLATLTPTVPEETQTRRATAQATPILMGRVTPTPMARVTSLQLLGVMVDRTQLAMIVTVHLATLTPTVPEETQTRRAMAPLETLTLMDQAIPTHTAPATRLQAGITTAPTMTAMAHPTPRETTRMTVLPASFSRRLATC